MPLLLHMTDLHLSTKPAKDVYDDFKIDIVPMQERTTRRRLLRNTLAQMQKWLAGNDETLSAIVITGDMTDVGAEDGFKQLETLLEGLGTKRPAPERIVVVPGNHDVAWRMPPSTVERYAYFLEHVRKRGYVTPLLDGIDIDSDGNLLPGATDMPHWVVDDVAKWVILPINSSNYCGSVASFEGMEDVWHLLPNAVEEPKRDLVRSTLLNARLHDVARISPGQLMAIRNAIDTLDKDANYLRIAALHHQLLPVSDREEFKPFESIVNLGRFRNFLARAGIKVVIHGHKHHANVYRDDIQLTASDTRRIHVVSGSTLGGDQGTREIYRLIDVNTDQVAPRMRVYRVPATESGDPFKIDDPPQNVSLWDAPGESAFTIVEAKSVGDAYTKLMAELEESGPGETLSNNVIVHVEDAHDALVLPADYPAGYLGNTRAEQQSEFEAVVKWWQRERSELQSALTFTHGARLRDYEQMDRVIKLLKKKTDDKGRAVVTLFRPDIDRVENDDAKFPSFLLVQFTIDAKGRFCCLGYFRKQELRYWWPVNVAELSELQREVYRQIEPTYRDTKLRLGPITTVAAVAVREDAPSRVAIPLIDRNLDMEKTQLWGHIYALVVRDPDTKAAVKEYWRRITDDLRPPSVPARGGTAVAVDGLAYVQSHLERLAQWHGSEFDRLAEEFGKLRQTNATYRPSIATGKMDDYQEWRKAALAHIDEIERRINRLIDKA